MHLRGLGGENQRFPQFAMVAQRRPRGAFLALPCSLGFRHRSAPPPAGFQRPGDQPPQKAQSKAERREGACNRAAEAQRRPFAVEEGQGSGWSFRLAGGSGAKRTLARRGGARLRPSRIPKARGSAPAKGPKQTGASCARLQAHSGGAATAFCGEEEQGSDATAAFSPIAKKPPE